MSRTAPAPSSESPSAASSDDAGDEPYLPRRFVPVPRAADRRDGWTSDKQYAFVAALARLPSVAAAARSVGMQPRSAHRLRRARGAADFAAAWDEALEIGLSEACSRALDRATIGQAVVVRKRGVVVGTGVRYEDRMLLAALLAMRGALSGRLTHQKRIARRREIEIYGARFFEPSYADYHASRSDAEIARDLRVEAAAKPFLDAAYERDGRDARGPAAGPSIRRL